MARPLKELNRENATLSEIERAMNCARTQDDFKRLQIIWFLHRKYSRSSVEELTKLATSTVRKLISLFNARGIDGIVTKPRPGRSRKVSKEEFSQKAVPLIELPE